MSPPSTQPDDRKAPILDGPDPSTVMVEKRVEPIANGKLRVIERVGWEQHAPGKPRYRERIEDEVSVEDELRKLGLR